MWLKNENPIDEIKKNISDNKAFWKTKYMNTKEH